MIQYIKVTISLLLSLLAICLYVTLAHIPAQLLIIFCNTDDTGSVGRSILF